MASYYEISKSVRITNADPIDGNRYIADTLADRDNLVTPLEGVVRAHNGLQVYVVAEEKLYLLVDINDVPNALWKEIPFADNISGDKNVEYVQGLESSLWEIKHDMNKIPSITVIDVNKKEVMCEVEHVDTNNVKLKFNTPFAGKAYLN
ncbi:MAG: hypothetical protein KAH32_03835 [Chlamydiia bacterium]|nr:hypothetical protein [Chlamydiia bacterium]